MAIFFTKGNNIVNLPLKPTLFLDLREKGEHTYPYYILHTTADAEPTQETG